MFRWIQIGAAFILIPLSFAPYLGHLPAIASFALNHPFIPGLFLVVFGILFGFIGEGFGLAGLFWHDRLLTRVSASMAVTLLFSLAGVFAFYEAGSLESEIAGPPPKVVDTMFQHVVPAFKVEPAANNSERLARFLLVGSLPVLVLLIAPALLPAAFPRVPRSAPQILINREKTGPRFGRTMSVSSNAYAWLLGMLTWLLGIIVGLVIVLILILAAQRFGHWLFMFGGDGVNESLRSLILLSLVLVVFYTVISIPVVYDHVVSAAFAICALIGLLGSAYELIYLTVISFGLPVALTMGLVAAVGVIWFALINHDPYKLRFPGLEGYYPKGTPGVLNLRARVAEIETAFASNGNPGGPPLVSDETALENWLKIVQAAPGAKGKPKLVVLAYSGGALRSGLWVSVVTDRLEQQIPGFGRHVRIVTGASGGMLGAGYYLLHRRDFIGKPDPPIPAGPYRPSPWVISIPRDSIDPVARFLALRDPFLAMLPRLFADDRGIRLENTWPELATPIRSLMNDEASGQIPSIILSPIMIEDGRRLLISNLDLSAVIGSTGGVVTADGNGSTRSPYSLSALEFFRLFPQALEYRLNTSVRMNASFPYVSPAVNLPTDPPRRVFDAGFYDNYGVQVATAWLNKNLDWLVANTSGVVLVQVNDAISVDARLGVKEASTRFLDQFNSGFRFFTSAPEAVESAATASTIFRNDEGVARLNDLFTAAKGGDRSFFTTTTFEISAEVTYKPLNHNSWPGDEQIAADLVTDVALDWYLTRAERSSLFGAIPKPVAGGQWDNHANRMQRLNELRAKADTTTGKNRDGILKQIQQAENYERLVQLETWWQRP